MIKPLLSDLNFSPSSTGLASLLSIVEGFDVEGKMVLWPNTEVWNTRRKINAKKMQKSLLLPEARLRVGLEVFEGLFV